MTINANVSGKLVTLRPFEVSDTELWTQWDIDPKVQEYMPEPLNEESSLEDQEEYLQECVEAEDEIHASIVDSATGTVIGTIALTEISEYHGVGEIGVVIGDTNYWGKGYASEAIQLFLGYIKENTPVVRVLAEAESDNIGVQKVLAKNGFHVECVCKDSRVKKGKRIDTVRMVKFL